MRGPAAVGLGLARARVSLRGCGGNGSSLTSPASIAATKARTIAVAAKKTKGTGTYRFALDTSMSVSDQKVDTHAEGVVDEDRGLASMTLDTAGAGGLMQSDRGRHDDLHEVAPLFVGGKKWVKLDLKKIASRSGVNIDQLNQSTTDPSDYLTYLRAAGPVEEDGRDTVRGVDTTALQGRDRPEERGEGQVRGGAGRDRQVRGANRHRLDAVRGLDRRSWSPAQACVPHDERGDLAIDTTAELYDFGAPIKIALPAREGHRRLREDPA